VRGWGTLRRLRPLEGAFLARPGDTQGARRIARAMARDPRIAQRAMLMHAVGDTDSMYVLLSRAIDARDPDAIWILNSYPVFHPLRKEPRYQQLLEQMGLPAEWRN